MNLQLKIYPKLKYNINKGIICDAFNQMNYSIIDSDHKLSAKKKVNTYWFHFILNKREDGEIDVEQPISLHKDTIGSGSYHHSWIKSDLDIDIEFKKFISVLNLLVKRRKNYKINKKKNKLKQKLKFEKEKVAWLCRWF